MRVFQGRPIISGAAKGVALVSRVPFNTLACWHQAVLAGGSTAVCLDPGNLDLWEEDATGRILCLGQTVGSTSSGAVWESISRQGAAPGAVLLAGAVDSLTAAGLVLVEKWAGPPIVAVDRLGNEFLEIVTTGSKVEVREDGRVFLEETADLPGNSQ